MFASQSLSMFFLLSALTFSQPRCASESAIGFVNRTANLGGVTYDYKVHTPSNWERGKKWPVILFLHGAGERGNDNVSQTRVGIGPALAQQQNLPAIIVFPQCPQNRWWSEPEIEELALKALDQTVQEFNGDPQRFYLTGISMGGYGTWAIARDHPGKFAAYAPVCGGVRPPSRLNLDDPRVSNSPDPYLDVAKKIGKAPVWVFHGGADPVVPVSESQKMVEALKSAGGIVRYSEYEGVGHNSWDTAYGEAEFFSWMLAQKLDSSAKAARQR